LLKLKANLYQEDRSMKKSKINIIMAGGGSGGHVFPIQSLIQFAYKDNSIYDDI